MIKTINEIIDIENIKNEEIKALFIEANNYMNSDNVENNMKALLNYDKIIALAEKIGDYAIVMARLYTGRMHQIRVHLYSKNLFMVGDKIYGRYGPVVFDNFIEKNIMPEGFFKRQALHAYSLTFNHPITDKIIKVKAPIPEDLKKLIKNIQNKKTND